LYVFIGNSGVLSFGQISFVAVGAWAAGVLTVPRAEKPIAFPGLAHFLVTTNVGNVASLALAAAVGGVFALAVGLPLMRLSGLAALIAFTLAGAMAGFAGGLYVHLQPLAANDLYLDLTFITLAMLVVGGAGSLLGAVVGALAINGIYTFFTAAVNTVDVFGWHVQV